MSIPHITPTLYPCLCEILRLEALDENADRKYRQDCKKLYESLVTNRCGRMEIHVSVQNGSAEFKNVTECDDVLAAIEAAIGGFSLISSIEEEPFDGKITVIVAIKGVLLLKIRKNYSRDRLPIIRQEPERILVK